MMQCRWLTCTRLLGLLAISTVGVSEGAQRPERPLTKNEVRALELRLDSVVEETRAVKTLLEKQQSDRARIDEFDSRLRGIGSSTVEIQRSINELKLHAKPSPWPPVIGGLIGFVASVLSILWYEWVRRPIVDLAVGEPMPAGGGRRFVHVQVSNRPQRRLLRKVIPRVPAYDCRAWVRIYPVQTGGQGHITFDGRWTSQREPGFYLPGGMLQPDPGLILVPHREDVFAGEPATIDVAVKFEGDQDCFGFNNENYLVADQRLPDHRVGQGVSGVVVRIAAGDLVRVAEFHLHNPGTSLNDFALTAGAPTAVWE